MVTTGARAVPVGDAVSVIDGGGQRVQSEMERLLGELAALRRVATLVARGVAPEDVFGAVAAEVSGLFGADVSAIVRFEHDRVVTVLGDVGGPHEAGARVTLDAGYVVDRVRETSCSARFDTQRPAAAEQGSLVRSLGVISAIASPIVVDGKLWGAVTVASQHGALSPTAERRLTEFTELVATAVANAQTRDQLMASRARLVTAGDAARRRVVRDLHDGAQQRLVHTIVTLKLARHALRSNPAEVESLLASALEHAERSNVELRELAHGILPASLTSGGVRPAIEALVGRLGLPVHMDVPTERFAPEVEASTYFIVAEALTNVVKHAQASAAEVRAHSDGGVLHVEVCDDGIGGAARDGHGLVGLADRAAALGGRLEVESPARGGTRVAATLPLCGERSASRR